MESFETENAQFSSELKKIKTSDRVHADIYNERFEKLINNDVALNEKIDRRIEEVENLIGNNISNSLENVAKESSPKNIENKVNSIDAKATNINNLMNTVNNNVINVNNGLSNVAKESSPKNIENKVIQLENKLNELEDKFGKIETNLDELIEYEKFDLEKEKNVCFKRTSLSPSQAEWVKILNINGKGKLYQALLSVNLDNGTNNRRTIQGLKVTLDEKVIYWHELDVQNLHSNVSTYSKKNETFGIDCRRIIDGTTDRYLKRGTEPVSQWLESYLEPTPRGYIKLKEGVALAQEKLLSTSKFSSQRILWTNDTMPIIFKREDGTEEFPVIVPTAPVYTSDKFLQFEKNCTIEAIFKYGNANNGTWETTGGSLSYNHLVSLDG